MNRALRFRASKIAHLGPKERAQAQALERQEFVVGFPYYSTVRFRFVRSGAGPYVYTLSTSVVRAFSYSVDQADCTSAGFGTGYTSTYAETNLQSKNETNAGETVYVSGLSAVLMPNSDARMAAEVFRNVFCELSLNGDSNTFRLGPPILLPSPVGLLGGGQDAAGPQAIPGGRPMFTFPANGWPYKDNKMKLPGGLVWRNSSKRDSQLNVIFTPASAKTSTRTITYTTQNANEVAAAGVRGYDYPSADIVVDVMVLLSGLVRGPRSRVQ